MSKEDIYYRLVQVFKDKLKVEQFYIFENDLIKDERTTIYSTKESKACCSLIKNVKEQCRAERTDTVVSSENFPEICRAASCESCKDYVCIPFSINEQKVLRCIFYVKTKSV